MTRAARFLNRWSPWRLRRALRTQARWLADERVYQPTDDMNTLVERLYRLAHFQLAGMPDPEMEALRYSVKGRTLWIDATETRGASEEAPTP